MKYNLIFTILLFFGHLVTAQQDTIEPVTLLPPIAEDELYDEYYVEEDKRLTASILEDSDLLDDSINERKLEEGFQEKYNSSDFDYRLTKPKESLWSKIKRKFARFLSQFFRTNDVEALGEFWLWLLRIIAIGIVGLVVYWLVKFLINEEGFGLFAKKDKNLNPVAQTITENIHKIDFNELIQSYEIKKSFRYAVRYQYLHVLKILNDKGLLEWDPEKTNLDYVNELTDSELKQSFARLTHIFDYVWYGEFSIDEESYDKIKGQFTRLKQKV